MPERAGDSILSSRFRWIPRLRRTRPWPWHGRAVAGGWFAVGGSR